MYPTSPAFRLAVRTDHRAVVRAEVRTGAVTIKDIHPTGGGVDVDARRNVRRTVTVELAGEDPVEVIDTQLGTYAMLATAFAGGDYGDLAASVLFYGDLVVPASERTRLVDSDIVPDSPGSPLAPFGNELHLWRGIEVPALAITDRYTYGELAAAFVDYNHLGGGISYADGVDDVGGGSYADAAATWPTYDDVGAPRVYGDLNPGDSSALVAADELVPLGVFVITRVAVKGPTITVTGSDRSLRISRARWTTPYTVPAGNVADGLRGLLEDRWPDVECVFAPTTATMNQAILGLESGNDPWADAVKIAAAAGLDLYFDAVGQARLEPARDYATATPDAVYKENAEAMVLELERTIATDKTYNGAIVTGEASGSDVVYRAEVWDEDPSSATYRYGPFGEVPQFFASPLITSDAMALATAVSILAKKLGAVESVEWSQIVDPAHDVNDVVGIKNAQAKLDRLLVLDRLSIPLSVTEPMTAVARAVRVMGAAGFADDDEGDT